MNSPIKVGLVGFGISAKVFHAPFLVTNPGFDLVSIVERHRNDSRELYPGVKIERSIEDLLKDPEIELVVITTPNQTHYPYTKLAIEAGKHVIVEKPFTNTSAQAKELVEMAARASTIVSVYQNRRYVSDFLTIKEILGNGALGDIHEFIAHYDRYRAEARPAAWREEDLEGSGILYDLGPHLIDQAIQLFGLPKAITADIRLQRPHARVDDYFEIWLHYDKLKVTLHAGMLVREMGPRYLVHGTKGSFIKHGEDPQEALLRAGELPGGAHWGAETEETFGLVHTEINGEIKKHPYPSHRGDYQLYYNNIFKSIRSGEPVKETALHGFQIIRLIELAIRSNENGCTISCDFS